MPARKPAADREIAELQLKTADPEAVLPVEDKAEKKDDRLYVELKGKKFRIAEETGLMALMEWAASADQEDLAKANIAVLAGLYHVLEDVIDPEDWAAFRAHARATKAQGDDLNTIVAAALEALAGRPTEV